MDNDIQQIILDSLRELKEDNKCQHEQIIARQDKTNGAIARANLEIAQTQKRQYVLRYILLGVVVTLMVLGFMPERFYEILMRAF